MDAFYQYSIKTLILLAITLLIRFFAGKAVTRFLAKFEGDIKRRRVSIRIINLFLSIFFILIFAAIWNIETSDLLVFFTSTITVIGIAFFANWSILSNITASLILYFNHPLKIGETVRIYDKEFDLDPILQISDQWKTQPITEIEGFKSKQEFVDWFKKTSYGTLETEWTNESSKEMIIH
jgi:small-conductance mechanosensitive channel